MLTGAGSGFCGGQDILERSPVVTEVPSDLSDLGRTFYAPLVNLIRSLEFPVVCAVNGSAAGAGAGASIALACDVVLAAESAGFTLSFAAIAMIPDAGGTRHLPRLLGEARAKGLALTGQFLPAQQAADWGLIWKAIPDTKLMSEARALTRRFATGPTLGLGLTKQCIQSAATNTLTEHLELEAGAMKICGDSSDYAEGFLSFYEKRTPVFEGN